MVELNTEVAGELEIIMHVIKITFVLHKHAKTQMRLC